MKTTMKNFALVILAVIALASCQSEDPAPAKFGLSKIAVSEGEYALVYSNDTTISKIEYTEGVDLTTYSFNWSADRHKLTMTIDEDGSDVVINVFEYTDVLVDGKVKPMISKVTYDDEGDGGKTIQINWANLPNQGTPSFIESIAYNFGLASETGDMTFTEDINAIILNLSTNNETVRINYHNNVDTWWANMAPEVVAVLFENEFDYPYFLSTNEVASIVNTYDSGKETPDMNGTFAYSYYSDGRINTISAESDGDINNVMFIWEQK